ncbi:MAG: hypothetical protein H7Z17_07895, partial [Fuerstia sp.]|nr:hypothetical protein [Fuerstiella sp.]
LRGPDPRLKASYSLSRILTQLDLRDMPYEEGMNPNRRHDETRHVSIGIWLIPVEADQCPEAANTALAEPAVTCDLRRQGIGVLVPKHMTAKRFLVAVADLDESWRFFLTEVRHQSTRPGGWLQLGLDVIKIVDPESLQMSHFRNRRAELSQS